MLVLFGGAVVGAIRGVPGFGAMGLGLVNVQRGVLLANVWVWVLGAGPEVVAEAEVVEVAQCFMEAVLDPAFVHEEAVEDFFGCEVLYQG